MARRISFRTFVALATVALLVALLPAPPAAAFPVAAGPTEYETCGRVFPDPHAYWPSAEAPPEQSPWAKGNFVCRATDFLGWQETLDGLNFLADDAMFGDFVEVYNLSGDDDGLANTVDDEFADVLAEAGVDGMTAGLPEADLERDQVPLYLVRVTDEEIDAARGNTTSIEDRQHFAYALSIHGIERAGVEGGIRAIEDLATWGSCEKHGEGSPADCAQENAGLEGAAADTPHPILETMPDESVTAGDALKQQSVWFLLSNPDGWRRGDKQRSFERDNFPANEPGFFYQRYNGNGMDMNRDWPTKGFTFRPYTPSSEPETRGVGEALKSVKEKWTGGIDLHGQLIDRAFSFTLIGGAERPFDKDRRVLQFTKGAWADAEERLAWSPVIKPNDAPESCVELGLDPEVNPDAGCDKQNRMYGVQWGTIWDTIDYTVTGALGDWIDSPIGLDADGIDNEMSMSHLSNCGVGTCFLTEFEQLHVDGNKSLIYAQMHYSLVPEDTTFDFEGRAAYLHNPERISDPGSGESTAPEYADLPPQDGFDETLAHVPGSHSTYEFDVLGPDDDIFNGGLSVQFTSSNLSGVSPNATLEFAIDQYRPEEENPEPAGGDEDWQVVNSYFNQSPLYLQSGAQVDANNLQPGQYRVRVSGPGGGDVRAVGTFTEEEAWPDPGQLPYDVSNMDFFTMLGDHVPSADKLSDVSIDGLIDGDVDLEEYDTLVVTDDAFLPGYVEPVPATDARDPESGTVAIAASGAGVRTPATSAFAEFEVEQAQKLLDAKVTSATVIDPDLYLQRQDPDGSWSGDLAAGETGRTGLETLRYAGVIPGRYRLEVHAWAGSGSADYTIEFQGQEAVENPSDFTNADRDALAETLAGFVEDGGNLVLTDNALRALEWMGLAADGSVEEQSVYAGHVQFSADGGDTSTYDDPLAANVNQPGAAEGSGHRHQVAEPVPTGYAIQDPSGGNMNTHPQWAVSREAFEEAGGRVVGTVGGDNVTLGEISHGDGVVRILGSLLPQPTEEFDHPYGLGSYAVTYSGYEVFRNLLDWDRDAAQVPPGDDDGGDADDAGDGADGDDGDDGDADGAPGGTGDAPPVLPATGGGVPLAVLALGLGVAGLDRLRRRAAAASLMRRSAPDPG